MNSRFSHPGLLALAGDGALTAGAGAGKTTALVGYYLDLVSGRVKRLGQLSPNRIVALTYTEKAALEMKERIRTALLQEGLVQEAEELETASVSTIHAFCQKILKEFPLQAGLDPEFTILDDPSLFHESVQESLLGLLDSHDQDLLGLLEYFPFEGPMGLLGNIRQAVGISRSMGLGRVVQEALLKEAARLLVEAEDEVREEYRRTALEFSGIDFKPTWKSTPQWLKVVDELQKPLNKERAEYLEALISVTAPRGIGPHKKALKEVLAQYRMVLAEPLGLELAGAWLRVMDRVEADYDRRKNQAAVLDYDDLQLITRRLLYTNPLVRRELKARYRLILVDEVQDTNPLQWQIINCLREKSGREKVLEEGQDPSRVLDLEAGRLLVVGDIKQSIYRFRGADVAVFTEFSKELDRHNPDHQVRLTTNYRSLPGLVKFYNRFFNYHLGRAETLFQASFGPEDSQKAGRTGPEQGLVELLEINTGESDGQTRELEGMAIAAGIKELISGSDRDRFGRQLKFSDVAVLVRKQTQLVPLEESLRLCGIPFQVIRSVESEPFPELDDILNVLEYLTNPRDTFLLAAMLRSPLAGLSDESLYLLRLEPGFNRLIGSGKGPPNPLLEPGQIERLERFIGLLEDLLAWRDRVGPAELIEKVLERTDLGPVLMAGFQGRERLAGLQALIEQARGIGSRAGENIFTLINRFRPKDGLPGQAVDSVPPGSDDTVKIMTIHKAKGLQFPVVFLAQSWQSLTRITNKPVVFRPGLGLGLKIRDLSKGSWQKTISYQRLTELNQDQDRAEEDRLLYVALTRAEDLLVLTGPETSKKNSWRQVIEEFRETDKDALIETVTLSGKNDNYKQFHIETVEEATQDKKLAAVQRVFEPVAHPHRIVTSVSALEDYALCPRLYYRRRLLHESPPVRETSADPGVNPTTRGLWLHKILERIDYQDISGLEELTWEAASQVRLKPEPGAVAEMLNLTRVYVESEFGQETSRVPPEEIRRELSTALALDLENKNILQINGQIDLFINKGDEIIIGDYKLARPDSGAYDFQMLTYGLAVTHLNRPIRLVTLYIQPGGVTEKRIFFDSKVQTEFRTELTRLGQDLLRTRGSLRIDDYPVLRPNNPADCPFSRNRECCG